MIKSEFPKGQAQKVANLIEVSNLQVNTKEVWNNGKGRAILVAIPAEDSLPVHAAPGDVMIQVLEGDLEFHISDTKTRAGRGDIILLDSGTLHSVVAKKNSKVLINIVEP